MKWILLALVVACGTESGDAGPRPLVPLAQGNRWVYAVSDPTTGESKKVQQVTGCQALAGAKAGVRAWSVETQQGGERTVSYDDEGPEGVRRHVQEQYQSGALTERVTCSPWALRAPPPDARPGDLAVRSYTEDVRDPTGAPKKTTRYAITWVIEAEEMITVPTGTFKALRVRKSRDDAGAKVYWYAPGVGKVKEIGQRTELLESYTVQ